MLDERDLQLLQKMMENVIDERVPKIIDERVPKIIDERVPGMIDERIARSENLLLNELDRVQIHLENRIDRVEKTVESLRHEVNACRLANETVSILMKRTDDLEKRVDKLEAKTA